LVTYEHNRSWQAGVLVADTVVDGGAAARHAGLAAGMTSDALTSRQLLSVAGRSLGELERAAADLAHDASDGGPARPAAATRLGPPVSDPDKILCVGLNYREHADETELDRPGNPVIFAKFRNCLVGATDTIVLPRIAPTEVDYEGEVAVVISTRCKDVGSSDALAYVAGVMAFNDVSARDLQASSSQWTAGKSVDTFAPCGPHLVTADEAGDLAALDLSTRVNGELRQHASTAEMIFPIAELVSWLSTVLTLEPGDVIATGTPAGVGFARRPPVFLASGDEVEVEIQGIGTLSNRVTAVHQAGETATLSTQQTAEGAHA
jgi:2-keto-4-pentenoate hydratase/2-oxohepta-3-ene-1,7-dioic acid hydratase in catechol pathway